MNVTSSNNTYYIEGKIDSSNAQAFEAQLLTAPAGAVTIDAEHLEYISSAGLRVLMKLRKSHPEGVTVLNVSPAVYDIFEMTGFTDILDVKKQLRQISIDGCELIGRGGNGSVYRISEDEIIKVYTLNISMESIERERMLARNAFIAGVPTAIPYDVVKVGEHYGIVFEMVKADVVGKRLLSAPERFDEYAVKYADLFKQIHRVKLSGKGLPATNDIYLNYADQLYGWYKAEEIDRLKWFIGQIPERETMVHGDFHTNNIMVQETELLIIDMAEISYGHPIYDLASSYYAHVLNPRQDPDSVMKYLNVTPEIAMRLWDVMMHRYFETDDPQKIAQYNAVIEGFCLLKAAITPAVWANMSDARKKHSVDSAKQYLFPRMEELLEALRNMASSFSHN